MSPPPGRASLSSGRTDAVVAAGKIRPLRIAEIKRAVGDRVEQEWNPNGIGQIRAGFHNDRNIRRPGDGETELIALHPQIRVSICA